MLTFLLSMVVLSALIFAGYRLNMYLYSRGVVGTRSHFSSQMESASIESLSIEAAQRMAENERNEGLHPVRIGLVLLLSFVVVLIVLSISVLIGMVH